MNFPDVPFDENLFASNTMLKSYWERSTNERAAAVIPDWPSEESNDSNDLRNETVNLWKRTESLEAPKVEELNGPEGPKGPEGSEGPEGPEGPSDEAEVVKQSVTLPEFADDRGALVQPKMSATNVTIIVLASLAALLLVIYFMSSMNRSRRRE